MKRSSIKRLLLLTLVTVTTVAMMWANTKPAKPVVPQPLVPAAYGAESAHKRAGAKAVEFTWKENGVAKTFSQVTQGKVVVLNLWATWCGPCRREIPDLVDISRDMADKGVVVLGVSVDQGDKRLALVKSFVEKNNVTYTNIVDTEDSKIAEAFGNITSIPVTYIINKNGDVVEVLRGMRSKIQFMEAIKRAM